jgi:uncharacterized protein DUF6265
MRTLSQGLIARALFITAPFAAALPGPAGRAAPPSAGWLAGCWALRSGDRVIEESWMPERGGVMLGMSRTSRGDLMREYEFVLLQAAGTTLEYRVLASHQPEVVFRAAGVSPNEVVFENPEHDFPKRIGYRMVSRDSLEAWVDGGAKGSGEKIRYPYHRVDCGAGR